MTEMQAAPPFTALLLAGRRPEGDPLALAEGVKSKALLKIANREMILHAVEALVACRFVGKIVISTPDNAALVALPRLAELQTTGRLFFVASKESPSRSLLAFLEENARYPILLTTADHPLLTPALLDFFCKESQEKEADLTVGFVREETLRASFPENKRTYLRFRDGRVSGANLFAFLTPKAVAAAALWTKVDGKRKKPLEVIRVFGLFSLLLFVLRALTLRQALWRAGGRLHLQAAPVVLPFAEAAIDVDKQEDLFLVREIFAKLEAATQS